MKYLPFIIIIAFCIGCNNQRPAEKKEPRFTELLKLYKTIKLDTLKVYTIDNLDSAGYEFKGLKIDTASFSLLPKEILRDTMAVYAIYKFDIDSLRTGLITRTPGEYESSSIKLLVYNKQKDSITDYIELSELFGDAGDSAEKTAWLYRDQDKNTLCFLKEEISHDASVEDEKDTTITTTDKYYTIGFQKALHDTLNKSAGFLYEKFKGKQ